MLFALKFLQSMIVLSTLIIAQHAAADFWDYPGPIVNKAYKAAAVERRLGMESKARSLMLEYGSVEFHGAIDVALFPEKLIFDLLVGLLIDQRSKAFEFENVSFRVRDETGRVYDASVGLITLLFDVKPKSPRLRLTGDTSKLLPDGPDTRILANFTRTSEGVEEANNRFANERYNSELVFIDTPRGADISLFKFYNPGDSENRGFGPTSVADIDFHLH